MIYWILGMFLEDERMLDNEYQWPLKLCPRKPHCFNFVEWKDPYRDNPLKKFCSSFTFK